MIVRLQKRYGELIGRSAPATILARDVETVGNAASSQKTRQPLKPCRISVDLLSRSNGIHIAAGAAAAPEAGVRLKRQRQEASHDQAAATARASDIGSGGGREDDERIVDSHGHVTATLPVPRGAAHPSSHTAQPSRLVWTFP